MEKKKEDKPVELTNSDEEALLNEDTPKSVNKHRDKNKAMKKPKQKQIDIESAATSFALRINSQASGNILRPSILSSCLNTTANEFGGIAQQNLSDIADKKSTTSNCVPIATAVISTTDKEKDVAKNKRIDDI